METLDLKEIPRGIIKKLKTDDKRCVLIIGEGASLGLANETLRMLLEEHISEEIVDNRPNLASLIAEIKEESIYPLVFLSEIQLQLDSYSQVMTKEICMFDPVQELSLENIKRNYEIIKNTYRKSYAALNDYKSCELRVGSKRLQKLR